MEILEVDINKIKPDVNQPRTTIDELDLREMSQSIITEGVINPIEVDEENVIVTGERRWRAAKMAGLKTVPVKVMPMGDEKRFMRQVIENIHNNTMTDWDTANSLKKLIDMNFKNEEKDYGRKPVGIKWLSDKTGRSTGYIEEKLSILDQSSEWKKAVKEGKDTAKFTASLKQTPEKYKEVVEKKFLKGEFATRDGAREFVSALKREEKNPDVIEKLLEKDYSELKGFKQVEIEVAKISPRVHQLVKKSYEPSQDLSKIVDQLKEWVKNNPIEKVGKIHAPRVVANINFAKALLEEWTSTTDELIEG